VTKARYTLVLTSPARRALDNTLPESVAVAAWELISGALLDNPERVGKPLSGPLRGQYSARRGPYRVRYRIETERGRVVVLDVSSRSDAYRT
jgi:mRNA interferase RelE/StbE